LSLCLAGCREGVEVHIYALLISSFNCDEWSDSRSGCYITMQSVPGTHWIGSRMALRVGLDAVKRKISYSSGESNQHFSVAPSLNRLSYPVSGNIIAEQMKRFVKYRIECQYSLLCSIMIVKFITVTISLVANPSCHIRISFCLFIRSSFSHIFHEIFVLLIISLCLHLLFHLLTSSVLQCLCPFLNDHLIFHTFVIYSFVRFILLMYTYGPVRSTC
jgi:hypothetical protein